MKKHFLAEKDGKRVENKNVFPFQVRRLLETEATPPVLPPTPRVEERD